MSGPRFLRTRRARPPQALRVSFGYQASALGPAGQAGVVGEALLLRPALGPVDGVHEIQARVASHVFEGQLVCHDSDDSTSIQALTGAMDWRSVTGMEDYTGDDRTDLAG